MMITSNQFLRHLISLNVGLVWLSCDITTAIAYWNWALQQHFLNYQNLTLNDEDIWLNKQYYISGRPASSWLFWRLASQIVLTEYTKFTFFARNIWIEMAV